MKSGRRLIPRPMLLGLLLAGVLPFTGCSAPSAAPKEVASLASGEGLNLVIIVVDSLRADHVGCYGYARNTSPFIDSLAAQGLLFEKAVSQSSYTRESVASLLSGLFPSGNPAGTGWYARPNPDGGNLPNLFAAAGYKTGFLTDMPVFRDTPFARDFADVAVVPTEWGESGSGPRLTARALEYAREAAGRKFLMYLHYLDPHVPYSPSNAAYRRFSDTIYPAPLDLYADVRPNCAQLMAEGFGPGDPRFDDLVIRYDAEIAETDDAVRALVEGLRSQGVLDNTLIVFTADHGEEFLEHRFVEHAWSVYEEVLHVPLILWRPGLLRPGRVSARVALADVLPTLVRLMGVPCTRTDLAGSALLAPQDGGWEFVAPSKPIISELLIETRGRMRAVYQGDMKYIAAQTWYTPEQCADVAKIHPTLLAEFKEGKDAPLPRWAPVVYEALYDLAQDPRETASVIGARPEQHAALRRILDEFRESCPAPVALPDAERAEPQLTPEREQELRNLGYL